MEKILEKAIEDFGGRIASVWEGLRPTTRSLFEHALRQSAATAVPAARTSVSYDARAEWELSRLLAALDDRVAEANAASLSAEQVRELSRMTETCALVLHSEAKSAEVFAQLLERALRSQTYRCIDSIADTLAARLAPSEVCELARHPNPAVRAIAQESLLQTSTSVLAGLLSDPVDAEIARVALERQAEEYGSEEARWIVSALERSAADEEDA